MRLKRSTSCSFNREERELLDRVARRLGVSRSAVLGMALRRFARSELGDGEGPENAGETNGKKSRKS